MARHCLSVTGCFPLLKDHPCRIQQMAVIMQAAITAQKAAAGAAAAQKTKHQHNYCERQRDILLRGRSSPTHKALRWRVGRQPDCLSAFDLHKAQQRSFASADWKSPWPEAPVPCCFNQNLCTRTHKPEPPTRPQQLSLHATSLSRLSLSLSLCARAACVCLERPRPA